MSAAADFDNWEYLTRNYSEDKSFSQDLVFEEVQFDDEKANPLFVARIEAVKVESPKTEVPVVQAPTQLIPTVKVDDPLAENDELEDDPLATDPLASDPLASNKPKSTADSILPKGATKMSEPQISPLVKKDEHPTVEYITWNAMKPKILHEYTTDQSIDITVSFLEIPQNIKVVKQDKTQRRLEELEEKTVLHLSQKEYIKHIETMHSSMQSAWESDDRVKALKVAIQAVKILCDTSVIKFYPSKFVLVSEILDRFSRLVFDRVTLKRGHGSAPLSEMDKAAEMCKNWFFKIASIRELLPRIYTEVSIFRCYEYYYVNKTLDIKPIITRLSQLIRGCADPIIQIYAQCYLVRKAHEVLPDEKEFIYQIFFNFLELEVKLTKKRFQELAGKHSLNLSEYFRLFQPALEWTLQSITFDGNEACFNKVFNAFINQYSDYSVPDVKKKRKKANSENEKESETEDSSKTNPKGKRNGMILSVLISVLPPPFVAQNMFKFINLIKEVDPDTIQVFELYRTLCVILTLSDPPKGEEIVIFNEIWTEANSSSDISHFIQIAEVISEFVLKFCSPYEINSFLFDILSQIRKFTKNTNAKLSLDFHLVEGTDNQTQNENSSFAKELISIIEKLIKYYGNVVDALSVDHFVSLTDVLRGKESERIGQIVLESAANYRGVISNPVIVSALVSHAASLHRASLSYQFTEKTASLHSLEVSEKRMNENYIVSMISKVDFGKDIEKQLNFLVECRHSFGDSDLVLMAIISAANALALKVLEIVGGKHTKKTAAFAKACVAFTYITISTMEDPFARLKLYTLSGNVAMQTGSLPQADGLFRSAVSVINEIPSFIPNVTVSTELNLIHQVGALCGSLLPLPGHPDLGPFYLITALVKVFDDFPWTLNSTVKTSCYLYLLKALHAFYQKELPYHSNVEGNDTLFRDDPEYFTDLSSLTKEILTKVNQHLHELETNSEMNATYYIQSLIETINTFTQCFVLSDLKAPQTIYVKALIKSLKTKGKTATALKDTVNSFIRNTVNANSLLDKD